ncbi:MAG: hypothetical protein H6649_04895 [Caldilineae bacterium]|nr:hypothetical protein [Caldilineae bacterium]
MPVIINDFEVLTPPPGEGGNGSTPPQQPAGQPLHVHDLQRLLDHLRARQARVHAD